MAQIETGGGQYFPITHVEQDHAGKLQVRGVSEAKKGRVLTRTIVDITLNGSPVVLHRQDVEYELSDLYPNGRQYEKTDHEFTRWYGECEVVLDPTVAEQLTRVQKTSCDALRRGLPASLGSLYLAPFTPRDSTS